MSKLPQITLAIHNKPLAPGTFQSILKQSGMSKDEFLNFLKKK